MMVKKKTPNIISSLPAGLHRPPQKLEFQNHYERWSYEGSIYPASRKRTVLLKLSKENVLRFKLISTEMKPKSIPVYYC